MKKLKFSILKYFALCSFGISIVQGLIDIPFEGLIMPELIKRGMNTADGVIVVIVSVVWIFIHLFVFFMGILKK